MNFEELYFWGKVEGCLTDYYVAVGVTYMGQQNFAKKNFFWCAGSENMRFSELPESLAPACGPLFDAIQTVFTGEFEKVIVKADGVSPFVHVDEFLREQIKIPTNGITELDRLSYVVHQVDDDCSIVPMGAVKKTPLNEVRKNEAFKGLKADQAFDVSNYVHFRAPMLKKNVELNIRKEGIYNHAFLDNASEDLPKGGWTVMKDTLGKTAVLRSKLWPGAYTYHKFNSQNYGSVYIGNGIKALDIPFMF